MRHIFAFALAACMLFPVLSHAGSKDYIYRSRAEWVKVSKLSKKQVAGVTLAHPVESVSANQIEAMLRSITMSKGALFKKELKTTEVFSDLEAKKVAGHIAEALRQATPQQVVNVSMVHKRPYFILRNDYLSNVNVFATSQGLHFYFNKLFARLNGDYEQSSQMDEEINRAKSLRVTLTALPGQTLTMNNGREVIMDIGHDFTSAVAQIDAQQEADNELVLKAKSERKAHKQTKKEAKTTEPELPVSSEPQTIASNDTTDVKSRLQKLEELRRAKLVTAAEYREKKKEILSGL